MTARVLVVEDDAALARGLVDNFRDEGYDVVLETRGDAAFERVRSEAPDLVVLDVMLPGRSGLDVLRDLRAAGHDVPVLVLTARGDVVDRVLGLELGADDYLPKPFAVRELLARAKALLRRAAARASLAPRTVEVGRLSVDLDALTATTSDGAVELTSHDLLVLKVLVERRGQVVSRADIVEEVCGLDSSATLRTVDNHVVALRRLIEDDPRRPRWLKTVRGIGYRLALPDTR